MGCTDRMTVELTGQDIVACNKARTTETVIMLIHTVILEKTNNDLRNYLSTALFAALDPGGGGRQRRTAESCGG